MIENLAWGAGYNIVAIPLAAGVFTALGLNLSPAVGALLMSASRLLLPECSVAQKSKAFKRRNNDKNKYVIAAVSLVICVLITLGISNMNNNNHDMSSGSKMDMNMSMSEMTSQMKDLNGDKFDAKFIEMMIVHHQGAIDMAELIPSRAKHQEIKDLGKAIIKAQTGEIKDMKKWQKEWDYQSSQSSH
ncbi:MAG: DUF305 domain-containing protein [Acidimicrobiia bacterium]